MVTEAFFVFFILEVASAFSVYSSCLSTGGRWVILFTHNTWIILIQNDAVLRQAATLTLCYVMLTASPALVRLNSPNRGLFQCWTRPAFAYIRTTPCSGLNGMLMCFHWYRAVQICKSRSATPSLWWQCK